MLNKIETSEKMDISYFNLTEKESEVFIGIKVDEKLQKIRLTLEAFTIYGFLCYCVVWDTTANDLGIDYACQASYKRLIEACLRSSYPESSLTHLKNKAIDGIKELCDLKLIEKLSNFVDGKQQYQENIYRLRPKSEWVVNTVNGQQEGKIYQFNVRGCKPQKRGGLQNEPPQQTTPNVESVITIAKPETTPSLLDKPPLVCSINHPPEETTDVSEVWVEETFNYDGLDWDSDEYLEIAKAEYEYNQRRGAYLDALQAKAKAIYDENQWKRKMGLLTPQTTSGEDGLPNKPPRKQPSNFFGLVNSLAVVQEVREGSISYTEDVSTINDENEKNLIFASESISNPDTEVITVNEDENNTSLSVYNSSSFINCINNLDINNKIKEEEGEELYKTKEKTSIGQKIYFDDECQKRLIDVFNENKPKYWPELRRLNGHQKSTLNRLLNPDNYNKDAEALLYDLEIATKWAQTDPYWTNNPGGFHSLLHNENFTTWGDNYLHREKLALESQRAVANAMNDIPLECDQMDVELKKPEKPDLTNVLAYLKKHKEEKEARLRKLDEERTERIRATRS